MASGRRSEAYLRRSIKYPGVEECDAKIAFVQGIQSRGYYTTLMHDLWKSLSLHTRSMGRRHGG